MTTANSEHNPAIVSPEAVLSAVARHPPGKTNLPIGEPSPSSLSHPAHNNLTLPRSPLIGRDHAVAAVQQLLLQEHIGLLTLTGPGGIGKTRLALQVAANLLDHFVDGVYFVSLSPISDPELVASAIAQPLGVREAAGRSLQESLQEYLRDKQLLLVLDNFEQILPAAPLVSALLTTCPRLKVLVTSRASLHLYGEQEFPVSPLALPDAKHFTPTRLTAYAAIDLFCQRARAVKPDFALTPENATAVAQICIGLDGLPLAIELAAARIKLFSPAALLARLDQRLTLLTGGSHDLPTRQRTLRDEIAWSYDLLTPAEQKLFCRLAVFVGGFTLEAAQAVGNINGDLAIDVLDGIATLVDQNLLKQMDHPGGKARFTMLETIREYGLAQMITSGEAETIRRRHANFFLTLAERTEPLLLGPRRQQGLACLESELDNLRAAFLWSEGDDNQAEISLRLAGALIWFAHFANHFHEVRKWLQSSLQRALKPTADRAKALWGAGLLAAIQADFVEAHRQLAESEQLWRQIGEPLGLAIALRELSLVEFAQSQFVTAQQHSEEGIGLFRMLDSKWHLALALDNLSNVVANRGEPMAARRLLQESVALFRMVDDTWGLSGAMISLGFVASQQGDYTTAVPLIEESLTIRRLLVDKWMITNSLSLLGEVRQRQGQLEQANNLYRECLTMAYEIGDKACIAHILYHLGTLANRQSQPEHAILLWAVAATLRTEAGGFLFHTLVDATEQERAITAVRTRVGAETFAAKWAEGQAMTLEQVIAYALPLPGVPEAVPATKENNIPALAPLPYTAGLTVREVEVLRLLAQGLTYAQIADNLVISRRTVNTHVTSIFGKLAVSSRAAATRFAIDHHLV